MDNETMQKRLGSGFGSSLGGDVVAVAEAAQTTLPRPAQAPTVEMEEEL
jgi:hypothetical protein